MERIERFDPARRYERGDHVATATAVFVARVSPPPGNEPPSPYWRKLDVESRARFVNRGRPHVETGPR